MKFDIDTARVLHDGDRLRPNGPSDELETDLFVETAGRLETAHSQAHVVDF